MTRSLSRAALALALLLLGTSAFATPITYQFGVTATTGPLAGTAAFGTFTFDSSIIPAGVGHVSRAGLFDDFAFTWNGISYNETTVNTGSLTFGPSGQLTNALFGNNCRAGICGAGAGPGSNQFYVSLNSFVYAMPEWYYSSTFAGTVTFTQVPTAVPEPTSLALLASGLVGMVASARRRRSKSA